MGSIIDVPVQGEGGQEEMNDDRRSRYRGQARTYDQHRAYVPLYAPRVEGAPQSWQCGACQRRWKDVNKRVECPFCRSGAVRERT